MKPFLPFSFLLMFALFTLLAAAGSWWSRSMASSSNHSRTVARFNKRWMSESDAE